MHIVILADPIDNQKAGVHFYTKNLINTLLKIDNHNKYTIIHPEENDFFENQDHIIVKSKRKIPFYETYRKFKKIPKIIKKLNPDLVLETNHIGPFRLPKHIKRAVIIYDLTPILFPKFHIKMSYIGHKIFMGSVIKNADIILAISENTKTDILKKYTPSCPIKVIYAGIDKPIKTLPPPKIKPPYILNIGTIEPRKNLLTLINAFLELNLPHKLVLGGAIGWKAEKILEKIRLHKNIILTGYLSNKEKAALYKNADIFVYPSLYEGFGLPPLEAMSYGTPTITSSGGSLKEIFQDHALIFAPHDKQKLKEHIISILNNPKLAFSLSEKGHDLASKYSWENCAKKTIESFNKLMNVRNP